jgi:hypothetical protein
LALPPIFITRAIEATPFPSAPSVLISYPHIEDWWNRYPELRRAGWVNRDKEWYYQQYKGVYQDGVFRRLRHLQHSATGRAVLAELRAEPSVYIFPLDFLPSVDEAPPFATASTDTLRIPQTPRERARGIMPPATDFLKRGVAYASGEKPGAVDVFYSEELCDKGQEDETLLHELVHAARMISGVIHQTPMGGGYGNSEEFYANMIEMIYRSEKRRPIHDYWHRPIDQAKFLKLPGAHALLTDLCRRQMSLCIALAQVKADFNPIKPIADKLLIIDL